MISEQELREIRDRAERARPGPWVLQWQPDNHPSGKFGLHRVLAPTGDNADTDPHIPFFWGHGESYDEHENNGLADGRFIAHARNDVPRLIDEVNRLKSELAKREKS